MLAYSARLNASATSPSPRVHVARAVLLKVDRRDELDLVPRAEPAFVDQVVADEPLAARPVNVVAQTASFSGNAFSVKNARGRFRSPRGQAGSVQNVRRWPTASAISVWRQRVAERRHVAIEAADRAAFVHDGLPVGIGFAGRERAVGEIGQRRVEADGRDRRALAIRTVAGHAGGAVDVLAGASAGSAGGRPCAGETAWACSGVSACQANTRHNNSGR